MQEWFGDVPPEWELVPLRYLVQFAGGGTPNRSEEVFWDGDIPWVSPKDMKSERIEITEEHITEAGLANSSTQLVPEDTLLVVSRSGILKHTIPVATTAKPMAINQDIRALLPTRSDLNARFLALFIRGLQDPLLNKWRSKGATVESLDTDEMSDTAFPIPPADTQDAIVSFLDDRTARIDALIEKKECLLELLEEKRNVIITEVTTTGLDQNQPMKSPDTRWLDEIPTHWRALRLDHLRDPFTPIVYGIVLPGPDQDEGVPIIKGGDCKPEKLDPEQLSKTTPEIAADYERSRLEAGELVYEIRGSVGRVVKVPPRLEGANLTQDTARIAPKEDINEDWLIYALESEAFRQQIDLYTRGATIQGVNLFDLRRRILPVPPLEKQNQIARHLEEIDDQIQNLKQHVKNGIDLLEEKRQALITAAVTGQIDVADARAAE